ncbi:MAG: single-stranded-DNA-specific exonuclease RecJ [Chloroflexi bacterium]|nr:single-stranded-DNA-specific exonuclease RecJ [Chloroflexota bacterium]
MQKLESRGICLARTHWNLLPQIEQIASPPGIDHLIAQLLHNRGISDPNQTDLFLSADQRLEADPFLLPDMHQAVNRIYQALFAGEKIAVYGDFDADGITATVLLVQGLEALGANVIPYIPHRLVEGYGLRTPALEKLHKQGISLVITVDTGITALEEVDKAHKMGMDIIITDHHVPPENLPQAKAVVNPKRNDSAYSSTELAGVGVAFKFLQALLKGRGEEDVIHRSLDLVALGTITDMVPLLGENRYWVKQGLGLLKDTKRLGLQEMMRCAGLEPGSIDADKISWILGPRINSAGRLDDANTSYLLLITQDRQEAISLASELERKNARRRQVTDQLMSMAKEHIVAGGVERPLLMAGHDDYPQGVMGLVAGRLADEFNRPVVLVRIGSETCRGSGRSIPQFDLMAALQQCQDILSDFGGHTKAAGFVVSVSNLPQLQQRLADIAESQLAGLDLRPHINIDAEVPLTALAGDTFQKIQQLAPFGCGNPIPTFLSRDVEVIQQQQVGEQGDHLRLKLRQKDMLWDAIAFKMGSRTEELGTLIDIVYTLQIDRWNGNERLRLNLLDFARPR